MISTFLRKIKDNIEFRIKLFLFISLIFNFGYAIFLFVVSQIYFSKWFFVMSIYYGLLCFVRVYVLKKINGNSCSRAKILTMRVCGCFLFLLNWAVSIMMFVLIYTSPSIKHHEITVITLATYTFSALALAIIGSVKHLRKTDYLYSCAKVISLISASVSMVTLTNTMLSTFGEDNVMLRNIILPILSSTVSVFIVICAILMIKKANHDLKVLKNE